MKIRESCSGEGLVVLDGVECEVAEQFAVFAEHSNVEVADQHDDASAAVGAADSDVVEFGAVAEGEDAGLVDLVVADSRMGHHGELGRVGGGFGERVKGVAWRDHAAGRVGSLLVVVADEGVDLTLEFGDGLPEGVTGPPRPADRL